MRRYLSIGEAERYVADLASQTVLVSDAPGPHPENCRDPADDYLLALATQVGATAIVTSDLDLLGLADPAVPILTPRDFVTEHLDR